MHDYDWLVIGSGFGGSVSALRLAEKGYRVAVLESGRRFVADDPATSWDVRRFLWAPALGCYGIQRLDERRPAGHVRSWKNRGKRWGARFSKKQGQADRVWCES